MKLEGKKYGEIIIKTHLEKLDKYIKALKEIKIKTYEIKVYKTHFVKFVKKRS